LGGNGEGEWYQVGSFKKERPGDTWPGNTHNRALKEEESGWGEKMTKTLRELQKEANS